MNRLQEVRNQAAHRGTMFNQKQLQDIRSVSITLLKEIGVTD